MAVVSATQLQTLAEVVDDDEVAISLYLDLSPAVAPTKSKLATRIGALDDAIGRRRPERRPARLRFDAGRARIEEFLEKEDVRGERHVHGAALLACGEDVFSAYPLWRSAGEIAKTGRRFVLAPLAARRNRTSEVLVLEAGRELGRVLALEDGRIDEIIDADRHIENRHKRGGWSQSKIQRGIDRDAELHLAEVVGILERLHAAFGRPPVVLAGTEEHTAAVHERLDAAVEEAVIGTIGNARDLDQDVLMSELTRLADAHDGRREQLLLARRAEQLGRGEVEPGLDGALEAAFEGRVETLLIAPRADPDVSSCPGCGRLTASAEVCPIDGSFIRRDPDGIEAVVGTTLVHGGSVWELIDADRRDLDSTGGIGVVVRF